MLASCSQICYIEHKKKRESHRSGSTPTHDFYLPLQFALYRQAVTIAVVAAISFFPCKSDKSN